LLTVFRSNYLAYPQFHQDYSTRIPKIVSRKSRKKPGCIRNLESGEEKKIDPGSTTRPGSWIKDLRIALSRRALSIKCSKIIHLDSIQLTELNNAAVPP
jgi:hypothetical protein